jgi:hypothetical protein
VLQHSTALVQFDCVGKQHVPSKNGDWHVSPSQQGSIVEQDSVTVLHVEHVPWMQRPRQQSPSCEQVWPL